MANPNNNNNNNNNNTTSGIAQLTLKQLSEARSADRNTSLITYLLPPGTNLALVRNAVRKEIGTSRNIKDRNHSKSVRRSLTQVHDLLVSLNQLPSTGLGVFAGCCI